MAQITLGTVPNSRRLLRRLKRVIIEGEQVKTHKHVIGLSGFGKSKLLESLWLQHFYQGQGVTLIDPHGTSSEYILAALVSSGFYKSNPNAYQKVVWIHFEEGDFYPPLDVTAFPFLTPNETVKFVMEAMHRLWPILSGNAAMFDMVIQHSIRLILANGLPLPELPYIYTMSKDERKHLLLNCDNPLTVNFWTKQWEPLQPRDQITFGGAAPRRADLLSQSEILKWSLGTTGKVIINPRQVMDQATCVLIDLGSIKEKETKKFLGCLFTTAYESAVESRAPRMDMRSHYLLIDEAASFMAQSGEAFEEMLASTRKFGLFVTLAHQTYSQMDQYAKLSGSLQNVGVKVAFQLGKDDAPIMARGVEDFDPQLVKKEAASPTGQPIFASAQEQYEKAATFLKNLPPRHAVVRIGNQIPTLMETLPMPTPTAHQSEIDFVKSEYVRRYYVPKELIHLPHEQPWNGGRPASRGDD